MLAPVSLYIHWPFCKSKCPYCDFNSHVRDSIDEGAFVKALLSELDYMCSLIGKRKLLSIFFGGGTPSLMSGKAVENILNYVHQKFGPHDDIEITLEANPTSVEAEKFAEFRAAGINRVSLGVQSLHDESLKFLGREHSAKEALKAVELAAATFPRYSFDLIYALPNQTLKSWEAELKEALKYIGSHMSLYQLTIEERTAFFHAYHQQKAFSLPVDDLAADLYSLTQDIMETHGLPAYEISNHAKPGFESQHNLSYWLGREYIGIGPGAHGRLKTDKWLASNTIKSPEIWLETTQKQGHGLEECTPLTQEEYTEERFMMRLRLTDDIYFKELPQRPKQEFLNMLAEQELIDLCPTSFRLTRKGLLVQQSIVAEMTAHMDVD